MQASRLLVGRVETALVLLLLGDVRADAHAPAALGRHFAVQDDTAVGPCGWSRRSLPDLAGAP